MANWKYSIDTHGKILRAAIAYGGEDLQSCKNTITALKDCMDQIKKLVSEEEWFSFEDLYENIESDISLLNIDDDEKRMDTFEKMGYTGNPPLDIVNNNLAEFYDLCDSYLIWIGL